uniref:thiol peroxidase n=1 Tax=Flavobacterium sp. TaxID=239 RepID=UPI0040493E71
MATIKLAGNEIQTVGNLIAKGQKAPEFSLTKTDLSHASLKDYAGSKLILNIFPSIDTSVCASSVRVFNQKAAGLDNTKVLCISKDLPFAQKRFCGAEGIENVEVLSDFKSADFGTDFGLTITTGPLAGLLSRAVVVLDENGEVVYAEQVPDITEEPNYDAALASL